MPSLKDLRLRIVTVKSTQKITRALQIEEKLNKNQILSLYLTLAPYGGNLEGIRAASLAYFGKEPKKLTLAQAALLVALPQAPEARRPDRYPGEALAARNLKADNMVATSWDAGLIVVEGLRKLGPNATPAQLRDFIANLQDFAGIDGIYDFKKYPERGLGPDASIVTRYDADKKAFTWVSQPGGAPLAK